jgi:transposase
MKKFIGSDRGQGMLMPYVLGDWLPESHLARFVVDIVDKLDFKRIYADYKGVGSTDYDPRMLLSLLFYCYLTSVFS